MRRHLIRTSVNFLLLRDGQVLLSRRANTGWADGMLCIPGGHVEPGETPHQAATREIKEEVGLDIVEDRIAFCCVAQRKSGEHEYVAYEFVINLKNDETLVNMETTLCDELLWVDPFSLPEDTIADFRAIIERGFNGSEHSMELGYV